MAVFLFDVLAMLLFIAFADFSRFRPLVPVLITGVFFSFPRTFYRC